MPENLKNNNEGATKKVILKLATKLNFQPFKRWKKVNKSSVTAVLLQVHTFEIPWSAAKFSLKTSLNSGPGTSLSANDKALWDTFPQGSSKAHLWVPFTVRTDFWAQKSKETNKQNNNKNPSKEKIYECWHIEVLSCPIKHSSLSPLQCISLPSFILVAGEKTTDVKYKILNGWNGHLQIYFYCIIF